MGSFKPPEAQKGGGQPGKILAPLDLQLRKVKWGEYSVSNLFKIQKISQMLSKEQTFTKAEFPVYSSESTNGGVIGYTDNPDFICDYQHPIYITFGDHTRTFNVVQKSFSVLDNVKVLLPCTDNVNCLLFFIAVWQKQIPNLGYARHWKVAKDCIIQLPEKSKGKIDFEFIDNFVRELERARVRELEAYLVATGLNNYELTSADKTALDRLSALHWKPFPITEVFSIRNTHNILASNIKLGSGTTPYLCASAENNGICGYISHNKDLLEQGNCVFIGGKTFVVSYQKDDFFSNDSHNIALYLKDYTPTRLNLLSLVTCVKRSLGHKYTWGDSVSKTKINKDTIMLPVCADGKTPDLASMEQIIAAVQKIVIADVAKYTARNLEATQQVIESQESLEERKELKVTLIHPEYHPGRIPLYTLRAACGYFDEGEVPEPEGWIDATGNGFTPDPKRHFAIHAKGDSMLPKIKDGDICIFEWYNAGTRNDEIVLTQSREYDPEYGGKYTIKRYHSEKVVSEEGWQHTKVELRPLNPDFDTVELTEDDDIRTIGIFKCVL